MNDVEQAVEFSKTHDTIVDLEVSDWGETEVELRRFAEEAGLELDWVRYEKGHYDVWAFPSWDEEMVWRLNVRVSAASADGGAL